MYETLPACTGAPDSYTHKLNYLKLFYIIYTSAVRGGAACSRKYVKLRIKVFLTFNLAKK